MHLHNPKRSQKNKQKCLERLYCISKINRHQHYLCVLPLVSNLNVYFCILLSILILEQDGVRGADVLLVVVVAHDLHVVRVELDFDTFVRRREETEGVESELKLWTDADEDASFGFDAVLPAELQSQDVFVLIRLEVTGKESQF